MAHDTRAVINDFLAQKRIALVGISRDPKDFSHMVLRDLRSRGYDVVLVRPDIDKLDGTPVYRRLGDIPGEVGGALLMTSPEVTAQVVRDCAEAGISRVWMHRGAGQGAVSEAAVAFCQERGMAVVAGQCPLMFLESPAWYHRLHAAAKKLAGSFPR